MDNDDGNDETEDSDLDNPGWRITREMMDRMDVSDWLRSELGGGGLRRMVSAYDADVPLGSGAGHNVALLCKFDPMKPAGKAMMMIDVAIMPDESMALLDVVMDKKATMAVNSTLGDRSPLKYSP